MMFPKRKPYRSKKLTRSAQGQPCQANFPGCTGGGDDSAFRHFNESYAGKGGSQKSDDCAGFIGCQHCENLYTGLLINTANWELFKDEKYYYLTKAYYNTIRFWLDEGYLK